MRRILILCLAIIPLLPAEAQDPSTSGRDQQMVGILSATFLYQSYLNLGFVADGFSGGLYDSTKAGMILDDLLAVVGGTRDELQGYRDVQMTSADSVFVTNLVQIADLLLQAGIALQRNVQSGNTAEWDRYMEFNSLAYRAIAQLLGLEGNE